MADCLHAAFLVLLRYRSEATMENAEFQLAAHREILIAVLSALARHEDVWPEINRVLDETRIVQDHEEDPGIVPSEAFARQNAMTAEITAILRAAAMRAALDPDAPRTA